MLGFSSVYPLFPEDPRIPFQVFLKPIPKNFPGFWGESEKFSCFIHSSLNLNISNPAPYVSSSLKAECIRSCCLNCRGTVIHTGKACSFSIAEAMKQMEKTIWKVLPSNTASCPLLLETPAGQGSETCTTIQEFSEFCNKFSEENFGVCIDTCHVFAAGYEPLEYLELWEQYSNVPICLVHFNDSKKPKGSRVDRHEIAGQGYIGDKKMKEILSWCIEREIPMVTE